MDSFVLEDVTGRDPRTKTIWSRTGGPWIPGHRVPTNIALESGLIDQNTLGVLQKRAQNDSYRQLYDSAQDDPSSGFRLLYVDPNAAKPKEEKKIDPKMFDAVPQTKKMTLDRMAKTGMIDQQLLKDFQGRFEFRFF